MEDKLLNLLVQAREQLIKGDYRALYAVWQAYGNDEDEDNDNVPPVPSDKKTGKEVVESLYNILEEC